MRAFLLDTARQVIIERGLRRTTLRAIAERARVDPALLHYYFATKRGLLESLFERVHAELVADLARSCAATDPPAEQLRATLLTYGRVISAEPYLPRLLIEDLLDEEGSSEPLLRPIRDVLTAHLATIFRRGLTSGALRGLEPPFEIEQIGPRVVVLLLLAPFSARADGVDPLDPWARETARLLLEGLGAR